MTSTVDELLPSAKDLMGKIALAEVETPTRSDLGLLGRARPPDMPPCVAIGLSH
jgi:hypothetical protein